MSGYYLIEDNSSYSETTGSLWFYSKEEATNFNADIANTNNSKSVKYKAKLSGNTVAQPTPNQANGILKYAKTAVSFKYLCNFWRSLKIELKIKWRKYFVLFSNSNDNVNDNDNANKIIFTIKDTKLYFRVATLSARDNRKLSKLLSKGFPGTLQEKPYFPSRGLSWKAQKDQVNVYLSINFLAEKKTLFPIS